jgi:hypothetical protein
MERRSSLKRFLVRVAIGLAVLFVAIQFVPVSRTNPPVTSPLAAPEPVQSILRRSCYDCHSNETRWPWYAYVAPVSWLVAGDVKDGRAKMNFSTWGEYSAAKRASKAGEMVDEVEGGSMPLPKYLRMHGDAKLSPEDVNALRKWADSFE